MKAYVVVFKKRTVVELMFESAPTAYRSGRIQRLNSRGDIDDLAIDHVVVDDHFAKVDPEAKLKPIRLHCYGLLPRIDRALNLGGTQDRILCRREYGKDPIA